MVYHLLTIDIWYSYDQWCFETYFTYQWISGNWILQTPAWNTIRNLMGIVQDDTSKNQVDRHPNSLIIGSSLVWKQWSRILTRHLVRQQRQQAWSGISGRSSNQEEFVDLRHITQAISSLWLDRSIDLAMLPTRPIDQQKVEQMLITGWSIGWSMVDLLVDLW